MPKIMYILQSVLLPQNIRTVVDVGTYVVADDLIGVHHSVLGEVNGEQLVGRVPCFPRDHWPSVLAQDLTCGDVKLGEHAVAHRKRQSGRPDVEEQIVAVHGVDHLLWVGLRNAGEN